MGKVHVLDLKERGPQEYLCGPLNYHDSGEWVSVRYWLNVPLEQRCTDCDARFLIRTARWPSAVVQP